MKPVQVELYSPLSPGECAQRLSSAIDGANWSTRTFGTKPVVGKTTESLIKLRKRIGYRNSYQSILTATMREEGAGTAVSGTFAINRFVRVFSTIWFGGVILIGGALFVGALGTLLFGAPSFHGNVWVGVAVPPFMLAFGIGLQRFCAYLARDEPRFLTDFLVQTLDAHPRAGGDIPVTTT